MNLRLSDGQIILEFPLTQAKRAWKIRRKDGTKKVPDIGFVIEEGDIFEWMITNEELRDLVSALRCLSSEKYESLKEQVFSINQFENQFLEPIGEGIQGEASLLPKQWKSSELTPYLFILFDLSKATEEYYLIDKRGKKVKMPLGYKLKAGDKLIWYPTLELIERIVLKLASLDKAHKNMVREKVFKILEKGS